MGSGTHGLVLYRSIQGVLGSMYVSIRGSQITLLGPFWTDLPELYYLNGTPFGPQITLLALLAFGVAWAVRAV